MRNLSWYGPDLTQAEQDAADALNKLVSIDQRTAARVASRVWLTDGVDQDEAQAVVEVQRLAAALIGIIPWFDDSIEELEWRVLQQVRTIIEYDPVIY